MLQTLANLFLPPGLLESDPTKKLATFAPQSYVDMIPEQERPQIAQMIQKQLLGGVFGGNRRQLTQDIGRGLTEYVSGRRALQDQARTSEIVSGRNDPTPAQNVLAAGAAEGSVGPTRANQQRLEQYQPPPMRETMLTRYQQLLAAGLPAQAAKFAEDIARVAPDETFTDAQTFLGPDGRPRLVRQGNRGTTKALPYQAPPKIREVNAGDRTELIDELQPGLPTLRAIGKTPDTPSDIREAMVLEGIPLTTDVNTLSPEQRRLLASRVEGTNRSKATNVRFDNGDNRFMGGLAGNIADAVGSDYNAARAAQNTLSTVAQIRGALDQAITGPGADARQFVLRFQDMLGVAPGNAQQRLAATAQVIQGMAQAELSAAEAMRGQGAITENERLLIRKAAAGTIDLTPNEIRTLTGAMEKTAKFRIANHNNNLQRLRGTPGMGAFVNFYTLPDAPGAAPVAPAAPGAPAGPGLRERAAQERARREALQQGVK
jgi:hypothetical protein